MPRQLRIDFPGAIHHVMSRGDRRENIYVDDVDRQDFLKTLAEACQKTDWQVHAYCLMRNHFHLVVETPHANLADGMHWLLSAYTIRLNRRHETPGHVFSGRYKALVVEGEGGGYLKTVCDYVPLNPVRAHLLGTQDRLLGYPWSSLVWYLAAKEHRPGWMRVDRLLGEHGIRQDTPAGRREFERRMEDRRMQDEDEEELKPLRRGVVSGKPGVSPENAGAIGAKRRRESRRGGSPGKCGGQGGSNRCPRIGALGLEGRGVGAPAQERAREAGHRGEVAQRDDSSDQEHSCPSGVGNLQGSEQKLACLDATDRKTDGSKKDRRCWITNAPIYGLTPSMFAGRYKALIVDGSGSGYLRTVCDYVHLNPFRAGLIEAGDRLLAYPWSSLVWYVAAREHRPDWMCVERLLGEHGIAKDSAAGRREFERRMEACREQKADEAALRPLRRGWWLGSEAFRREVLERMEDRIGDHHSGEVRREWAERKAERIIVEELRRLGWKESDLGGRRKSDPGKLGLAARLRKETTLPLKWIAGRVRLGTSKSANRKLHHWMRANEGTGKRPRRAARKASNK